MRLPDDVKEEMKRDNCSEIVPKQKTTKQQSNGNKSDLCRRYTLK